MAGKNKVLLSILLLFIILRVYRINNPLTDYIGLRQVPTADIARNFCIKGADILYPQYSTGGGRDGYIEIEFQILPYITSMVYRIIGTHETAGRVVALLFSVMGFVFLYMLLGELGFENHCRLLIMLIYSLLPQNIYLSRCFMPEPVMLSLITIFAYYAVRLNNTGNKRYIILSSLSGALAVLSKAPAAYILLLFFPLVILNRKYLRGRFLLTALIIILILAPPFLYYFHSYRLGKMYSSVGIWETGHGHISKWADLPVLTGRLFWNTLTKRLYNYTITPVLFPFFISGIWILLKKREFIILFWSAGVLSSFVILARGTIANPYYLYPLTPLVAVFSGAGLFSFGRILRKDAVIMLIIGIMGVYSWLYISEYYIPEDITLRMGKAINSLSARDEKVLTVLHSSLYYSGRYGYLEKTLNPERINHYKELGVRWFGYPLTIQEKYDNQSRRKIQKLSAIYNTAAIDEDFIVFDLLSPPGDSGQSFDNSSIKGLFGTKEDSLSISFEAINPSDMPILTQIRRQGLNRGYFFLPPGKSRINIKMPAYPHLHYLEILPKQKGRFFLLQT